MNILIAGAGEVGYHIAKLLSLESHQITLVDIDRSKLNYAKLHLDIDTIFGDASTLKILKESRIESTDLLIAVTSYDSTNFMIAIIGKKMGSKKTIARLGNWEYFNDCRLNQFKYLGIDHLISPEQLAADEIERVACQSTFNDSFLYDNGELMVLGAKIFKSSPINGMKICQVKQEFVNVEFVAISVERKGKTNTLIPNGDTLFETGDQVYFVTNQHNIGPLSLLISDAPFKIKKVMLHGINKISIRITKLLSSKNIQVRILEKDKEKAESLDDLDVEATIIHGDATNAETLESSQIRDSDAFMSLTNHSETNIMSCLIAKKMGAKKTIALVENMDYIRLSKNIGIDVLINKKFLAASQIFRFVRKGDILALTKISIDDSEVLEFKIKSNSIVCNRYINKTNMPKNSILAGVIRNGKGIIPKGKFQILAEDHVLVFCRQKAIKKIEAIFK